MDALLCFLGILGGWKACCHSRNHLALQKHKQFKSFHKKHCKMRGPLRTMAGSSAPARRLELTGGVIGAEDAEMFGSAWGGDVHWVRQTGINRNP